MSSRKISTVDPLVPLTLLEAVRDVDRPEGEAEAEYVPELLNKRLGTHDTVYAQIRRYSEAVRRGTRIELAEVVALVRLIGRRPDAAAVFAVAGAAIAQKGYSRISAPIRGLIHALPTFAARPLARRRAKKIAARYFGATLERYGSALRMRIPEPRTVGLIAANGALATSGLSGRFPQMGTRDHQVHDNPTRDPSDTFYDAGLKQLLSLLALE